METQSEELLSGRSWFIGAGVAALILSFCLFRVDEYLSQGPVREHEHNERMRALRTAQLSVPSRVTDSRQLLPIAAHQDNPGAAIHSGSVTP